MPDRETMEAAAALLEICKKKKLTVATAESVPAAWSLRH